VLCVCVCEYAAGVWRGEGKEDVRLSPFTEYRAIIPLVKTLHGVVDSNVHCSQDCSCLSRVLSLAILYSIIHTV